MNQLDVWQEYLFLFVRFSVRFRRKTNKGPLMLLLPLFLEYLIASSCLQYLFLIWSRERNMYDVMISPTQTRRYTYTEYDMLTRHAPRLHNSRGDVNWLHLIKYMHCSTHPICFIVSVTNTTKYRHPRQDTFAFSHPHHPRRNKILLLYPLMGKGKAYCQRRFIFLFCPKKWR